MNNNGFQLMNDIAGQNESERSERFMLRILSDRIEGF
jgi:hypothetical protein